MSLKALLVDDEYPSRNELRFRLERYPEIEVVGEAANAREALQLCSAMDYDVVFLDIQMPGMDGVELAQALRAGGKNPKVVFVTAYEEYAVNAFKVRATDYLLKPFDDARLDDTV
ncbi:MAG: response regulator, partial [Thermaerobacter sp.]|nr:response regulator [Thermaerobacter sp.]